jgi:hypothetical protein
LLQFSLLGILAVVEIAIILLYWQLKITINSDIALYCCVVSGSISYSLYYMLCICGPLDMAKVEMLKNNLKFIGMLYSVLSGF